MSAKTRTEVLIVGGGIGGVASALALARRGLRSRVLEKAPEFGEIGYGIQQGPNAYRMLDWLGVMRDLESQAVFTKNLILIDALTDKELTRISCGAGFRGHFRAPYTVVHRRDLHGALLEACRKRDEISLHTSKELVSFDDRGDGVVAKFADGSEYEGRAMIGADGLRSRVREILIGDGPPRPAGHVTYRGVVPFDHGRGSIAVAARRSYYDLLLPYNGQVATIGSAVVSAGATARLLGWMAGTTWMADAPVPMTATRSPVRSWS